MKKQILKLAIEPACNNSRRVAGKPKGFHVTLKWYSKGYLRGGGVMNKGRVYDTQQQAFKYLLRYLQNTQVDIIQL